jgi:hypothetical protein
VRYAQKGAKFGMKIFLLAAGLVLSGCADQYQPAKYEPPLEYRLETEQENKISAEMPAWKAAALKCSAAIGRDPLPIAANPGAAAKYLFPVAACNDFLTADEQRRHDLAEEDRLDADSEAAYHEQKQELQQEQLCDTIMRSGW